MKHTHGNEQALVQFGEFGAFRVLDPGLLEIVDGSALAAVGGGNFGCVSVGDINAGCNNRTCFNNVCIQNLCG